MGETAGILKLPSGWNGCPACGLSYSDKYNNCPKCAFMARNGEPVYDRRIDGRNHMWDGKGWVLF